MDKPPPAATSAPGPGAHLVTPGQLALMLASPAPPTVLDVRWRLGGPSAAADYAQGHIPGAVFVDLDRDLAGPPGPGRGRHPLPGPRHLELALRSWGAREGAGVVAYDGSGGLSAARAWWLLRWAGLRPVYVLDGGLDAWAQGGRPLTAAPPTVTPSDITVTPGSMPTLDAAQAAALARSGLLLDARAAERYRGDVEPVDPIAGHIPGARSAPTTENLTPAGTFASAEALRQRFAALGVADGVAVGVYCGSGVTAAHEILALAVAGIPAALYPGSWSEWASSPDRPVATGPNPWGQGAPGAPTLIL